MIVGIPYENYNACGGVSHLVFCRYSLTYLKYLLFFVIAPYVQSLCVYSFGDLRYAKNVAAVSVPG